MLACLTSEETAWYACLLNTKKMSSSRLVSTGDEMLSGPPTLQLLRWHADAPSFSPLPAPAQCAAAFHHAVEPPLNCRQMAQGPRDQASMCRIVM